jgi:hypothetical protein
MRLVSCPWRQMHNLEGYRALPEHPGTNQYMINAYELCMTYIKLSTACEEREISKCYSGLENI